MKHNMVVRKADLSDIQLLVALMKDFYAEANFVLDEGEAAASFYNLLSRPPLARISHTEGCLSLELVVG